MSSGTRSPRLDLGSPDRVRRSGAGRQLAVALAGLLAGSAGVGCGNEEGWGPLDCEDQSRELGTSEQSSLGFSADDVLAVATAPTRTSLDWRAGGPASDTPGIELQLTPAGTVARERGSAFDNGCPRRLEADVEVNLRTADSSLSSTFAGTLLANAADSARLVSDVSGSAVTANGFGIDAEQLSLDVVFTRLGAYGAIGLVGTTADATPIRWYARFPDTRGCHLDAGWHGLVVPDDADLGGFDAGSSLSLVTAHLPTRVIWDDRSETALALSVAAAGPPCATLETRSSSRDRWSLSYPVTVDAASEDGRWSGRYSGIVSAEPLDGGFMLASLRVRVTAPAGEFAAAAGVPSVDVNAFDSGILDLAIDVDSARGKAHGELDVAGMEPGPCLPNPEEPPAPGRLYTAPCENLRQEPVLRGTLGG